jgi:hypothetical protein
LSAGRLGRLALAVMLLALPSFAVSRPASVSGYVRDTSGIAQMGAVVEIVSSGTLQSLTVFTDDHGFYSLSGLTPGNYHVRVSAASFLPSLRENVNLRAGANRAVNITLNTLFEAIQTLPRKNGSSDQDDWKWTLRSSSNRPILRVLDNGPVVVTSAHHGSESSDDQVLKARVAFLSGVGADDFNGSNDMNTAFSVERSIFNSGMLSVNGNVGYGSGPTATVLHAAYSHTMPDGSNPQVALTMRRFATPDTDMHLAALQALAFSASDSINIGDKLGLSFGSELQTVQFTGRVTAVRPFGSADYHLTPNTVVEYRYATSEPNMRMAKGFDTAPADLSESGPRASLVGWQPSLERAHHHEISVSRRFGNTNLQFAAFADRVGNIALNGTGDVTAELGDALPDVYSNTFSYNGGELDTNGLRFVVERKLLPSLTATLDYAYGGVLNVAPNSSWDSLRPALYTARRHAVATKVSGTIPVTRTRWISSYRWTSGEALTPVDMFNASPGQSEPYWSLFIRQPIPGTSFVPGHMEALLEVRNLLAEGYVPVISQDGGTVYLVQAPRVIRGGVSFTF